MVEWTEEMLGRLRAEWAAGTGATAIGVKFGVSKNAIIGKVHRMQLPPRPSPIRKSAEPKRIGGHPLVGRPSQRREASAPSTLDVLGGVLASVAAPALPVAVEMPPPVAPLVPVRGWSGRECCWPIGEPRTPGFRYCDGPALERKSYCAEHQALAVVRVPVKTFMVPGGDRV